MHLEHRSYYSVVCRETAEALSGANLAYVRPELTPDPGHQIHPTANRMQHHVTSCNVAEKANSALSSPQLHER